jgi:hypothetical protein
MALYELTLAARTVTAGTIRVIRRFGTLSIAEVGRRVRAGQPIVSISTTDYPVELDSVTGHRRQHELLFSAYDALVDQGQQVNILYRPSEDWQVETVSLKVAKNLMQSELVDLLQDHD